MTCKKEIKQAAIWCGCIEGTAEYYGFIEGCNWLSIQDASQSFDELNAKQKAGFMQENLGWARTCDLKNELKIRNEL